MLPLTFAVVTDVHAGALALDACLARVEEVRIARGLSELPVHCLGDVLDSGPDPLATLRRVRASCAVTLRGNHESYVFDFHANPRNARYHDPLWKFIPWTHARLPKGELEAFEKECVFSASLAGGRVHLFHASAESNGRNPAFVAPQDLAADGASRVTGVPLVPPLPDCYLGECASLVFAGHNHYAGLHWDPMKGSGARGTLWVNSGSVGYPFVEKDPARPHDPVATFVVAEVAEGAHGSLSVSLEFQRVAYDGKALLQSYVESGALADCAPFSQAILCQSYFNEDVVYPFFRQARAQGWLQPSLPRELVRYLAESGYTERLRVAFDRAGLARPMELAAN